MHILVFGFGGQVATELRALSGGAHTITALDRAGADLTDPAACAAAIAERAPDAVINAAAYTAVNDAETHEATAHVINADAPAAMAQACAARDIPFVTISTDYVFSGTGTTPWAPDDPTGPQGAYGRTKRAGEEAVIAAGGRAAILRTSWVVSAHGTNFVKTMLRLGAERDSLTIVADQIGGPTGAADIAAACIRIAQTLNSDPYSGGIYHFSGGPDTSWADFARAIFNAAGITCTVVDITSQEYPMPAARPLNSRMDCTSTHATFGIARPDWRTSLHAILTDLGADPEALPLCPPEIDQETGPETAPETDCPHSNQPFLTDRRSTDPMTQSTSRKGIILAGGSGTRLYPITVSVSKQLLPIYDKPMIYYPLSVLMLGGIREIAIITTPEDQAQFQRLMGDGSQWGLSFTYIVQPSPDGLAQAYLLAKDFLNGAPSAMVLGDNIFFGHGLPSMLEKADQVQSGGTVFGYHVADPERYGVVAFAAEGKANAIIEKPPVPPSNYAVTGLYFLDSTAPDRAAEVKPSDRGELEITTLLETYLHEGSLSVERMGRGYAWLDTGTHGSLLDAGNFVRTLQMRQGLQTGSPDEIAFEKGWLSPEELERRAELFKKNTYGEYLFELLK